MQAVEPLGSQGDAQAREEGPHPPVKGSVSLSRWFMLLGVLIALGYWRQRRRRGTTPDEQQSASRPSDPVDEGLMESIAAVERLRLFLHAASAAIGQVLDVLRRVRESVPSRLTEPSS